MKKLLFCGIFFCAGITFGQEDSCMIYIPNSVSLRCDQAGMDFLLIVQNSCPFSEAHFMVFDRWGKVLQDSHDLNPEFDASELPQATYFYLLNVIYPNGRKESVEGNFVVLK